MIQIFAVSDMIFKAVRLFMFSTLKEKHQTWYKIIVNPNKTYKNSNSRRSIISEIKNLWINVTVEWKWQKRESVTLKITSIEKSQAEEDQEKHLGKKTEKVSRTCWTISKV